MRLLIIPLLMIALSATLAWAFGDRLALPESTEEVVAWLRGYGDVAWLVGASVILADSVLPTPSDPAIFTMGIIYGPFLGGLIGGGASMTAGLIGFGVGRLIGRRGAVFLVGEKDLARAERFYERWGVFAVAFGRAVGGPAEALIILAGLSSMPIASAFLAIAVGGLGAGFVMAALGTVAVEQPVLGVALALVLVGSLLLVARWLLITRGGASAT